MSGLSSAAFGLDSVGFKRSSLRLAEVVQTLSNPPEEFTRLADFGRAAGRWFHFEARMSQGFSKTRLSMTTSARLIGLHSAMYMRSDVW